MFRFSIILWVVKSSTCQVNSKEIISKCDIILSFELRILFLRRKWILFAMIIYPCIGQISTFTLIIADITADFASCSWIFWGRDVQFDILLLISNYLEAATSITFRRRHNIIRFTVTWVIMVASIFLQLTRDFCMCILL